MHRKHLAEEEDVLWQRGQASISSNSPENHPVLSLVRTLLPPDNTLITATSRPTATTHHVRLYLFLAFSLECFRSQ